LYTLLAFEATTTSSVTQWPLYTWQVDEGFSSIHHGAFSSNDRISFDPSPATPCNVMVFKATTTTILVSQRPLHAWQFNEGFSLIHHCASSKDDRISFVTSPATPGNITGIIRVVTHIPAVTAIAIVVVETTFKVSIDHAWVFGCLAGAFE
jgi:hypothetical protein